MVMSAHGPSSRPERFGPPSEDFLVCDGQGLKRLLLAAMTWLDANHQIVNALNVFPIPDGDTGTNMLLTMQAAFKEVAESQEINAGKIAHAVAHGALMGARGNSGVILSQIWRGFARRLDSLDAIDAPLLAEALQAACDTAYRGVGRPVEGTILTVIKDVAAAVAHPAGKDLRALFDTAVSAAHLSVARTPELLPVLKQAGVVDAGGKGLALILEGMLRHLNGQPVDKSELKMPAPLNLAAIGTLPESIEPGQEWEVVLDFRPQRGLDLPSFYNRLDDIGTSIQLGEGDGLYRLHIHLLASKRLEPVALAEELGTVDRVRMENLVAQLAEENAGTGPQAQALPLAEVRPGQIGIIAVSPGQGLSRIMASLGAAAIIPGGQTMNPSTQEIVDAIERLPTDRILILPNNRNIILAAQQAAELSTGKRVAVVPSKTVPQGIAALLNLSLDGDLEATQAAMEKALQNVESGEITTATRSVEIDGVAVQTGQIIGLHNGLLKVAGNSLAETAMRLLDEMQVNNRELITLYHGADVTAAVAEELAETMRAAYPAQTFEVHDGGQPHYHYILSAE
jgi:DAK2 domain fusion protein YloV